METKKRIAIVTGATGGIGSEFVKALFKEKLDEIWMIGRSLTKIEETGKNILESMNEKDSILAEQSKNSQDSGKIDARICPKLISVTLDLTKYEELAVLREKIQSENADIRYLINNAGIAAAKASTEFMEAEITQTISLNCTAPVLLTNLCIPFMEAGSHILNLSSASAFQPVPYINLYASTKAFERSYSRALNVELKEKGITVTAVCPSWVDTKLLTKEVNGKKIHFAGMVSPDRVVKQAMKDTKKGKDMSICSFYVKCQHFNVKIWPQRFSMKLWMMQIRKYLVK